MKKSVKIITCAVTAVAVAAGASLGIHFGYADKNFVQKEYNIKTNFDDLTVAVISDLQLPNSSSRDTHQYKSFESTLKMLINEKHPDVLIIAGDFTDLSTRKAWGSYKEIFEKAKNSTDKMPIVMGVMGNHDFWLPNFGNGFEIPSPAKQMKRYTKYTGLPVYSHQTVNGYHFIMWSSANGSYDKSYRNKSTARAEIEKAIQDDPSKPVFVVIHLNPQDTAYGSDEWGNSDIADVLKDYPQVISLSGHSHYSIIDERSIFQDKYTAVTTQSLDYIELESGKFNGSIPKDAYGNLNLAEDVPACLLMHINSGSVTIERLEANTGKTLKYPWVINAPFDSPQKYTLSSRKANNAAPVLAENLGAELKNITDVNGKKRTAISFKSGTDDDFVHSYRLRFLDGDNKILSFAKTDYDGKVQTENGKEIEIDELLYFSDFCLGIDRMSNVTLLRLPENMPKNIKYIEVTAIDSPGATSNSVLCRI